jgi:DNA-binding transcriptional ArsR family regulator
MKIDAELFSELAETTERGIADAAARIAAERDQLLVVRAELEQAMAELDVQVARCERILKAAEREPAKKKKRAKAKGPGNASPASREAVVRFLREHPEQAMTATEVAEGAGVTPGTARAALANLRAEELVRLAGKRQQRRGVAPSLYRLMSRDGQPV